MEGHQIGLVVLVDDVVDQLPALLTQFLKQLRKSADSSRASHPAGHSLTVYVEEVELLSDATTFEVETDGLVFPGNALHDR